MDWKNKYLKYKVKYLKLKNSIIDNNVLLGEDNNVLLGGDNNQFELNPDEEEIFAQLYKTNIDNGNWNKKSIILDCISSTKMQTETVKFIKFLIDKEKIIPNKKQLEIALVFSVFGGYYLIVEELLKLGANANINYGNTTLVDTAISFYFYKTAKILMKYGGLSKKYYSPEQFNPSINFSNDPENYINQSKNSNKLDEQIYLEFKKKLLEGGNYNFENLSRKISKKN